MTLFIKEDAGELKELVLQVSHLILVICFRCEGCFKGSQMIKYTYLARLKIVLWFVFDVYGLFDFMVYRTGAYSDSCQTYKKKLFAKLFNNWKLLTCFPKIFILDVWQGSKYASVK